MDGVTVLPARRGSAPRTHRGLPHTQLDQQPQDPTIRVELARRAFALPGVVEAPSGISVPGARALVLTDGAPRAADASAFIIRTEFAHLHPAPDFSLHLTLPESTARAAIDAGWAEWHPFVDAGRLPRTVVMVYAPRTVDELEVLWSILKASHRFATGSLDGFAPAPHCGCVEDG